MALKKYAGSPPGMNFLSLLAFTVYAAESIISPIPDDSPFLQNQPTAPTISFAQLTSSPTISQVLAATTVTAQTPTPTPTPSPPSTPAPTPRVTKKNHFTIGLLGDSMIDTLGPEFPALKERLVKLFPGVSFTILNAGVGATNMDYGKIRLTNDYTYLGRPIPALLSQNPDILLIESFAYNPYPIANPGGLDKQWTTLASMVDIIRANLPNTKIMIGATIAPDTNTFGDGAPGISFDPIAKREHTAVIREYLENATRFATSQHLPLADAYHPSLNRNGNGTIALVNPGDHIHYSDAGRNFFAQRILETILANHLLE